MDQLDWVYPSPIGVLIFFFFFLSGRHFITFLAFAMFIVACIFVYTDLDVIALASCLGAEERPWIAIQSLELNKSSLM